MDNIFLAKDSDTEFPHHSVLGIYLVGKKKEGHG